jgi:hypothetical protein
MSESSTYQEIHGHLADLRLCAAAEALPGALDQARNKGSATPSSLHRLLGVEVASTEARRRAALEASPARPLLLR